MTTTTTLHVLLVRYLLGDLPAPMREQVEQDYFANDQLWEALQQAETDLIDSYVSGGLSDKQREQFERYFLVSPERRLRVSVAQSLMAPAIRKELALSLSQSFPFTFSRRSALRSWAFLSAVAAVLLAVTVAVLSMQNHRLHLQLQSAQAALRHPSQPSNQVDGVGTTRTASAPSWIVLHPGMVRSGSGNTEQSVSTEKAHSSIVLMLDLRQDKYPFYDLVVQTAEGQMVQRFTGLRSRSLLNGRAVAIEFPSWQLPIGEYIVELFAGGQTNLADSYVFSVRK